MNIETERMIIRTIQRGDEKVYARMAGDGSLSEIGFDENFSDWAEDWINEAVSLAEKDDPRADYIPCTIVLKETGKVIGNVGCTYYEDTDRIGICYFVGTEYRRQGYVSEAVRAYITYFFGHYNEKEIIATIKDNNIPSWKTAEKCGFELTEIKMYKDLDDEKEELYRFYKIKSTDRDNVTIRLETERDYRAVEELTRDAFWNVYKPGADEHYYVHSMRNHPDFIPELAFVLEKEGRIIGNIMYTKARLEDEDGNRKTIVSFGPLCVAPEYQRQKYGKLLIEHSFDVARKMGYDVNINFGNPGNYVSRGFVSCKKKNVSCFQKGNYPTALLVCELIPGALDGKEWMFIPSTAADCCEDTKAVEEFDKGFPEKEKKWMPSQEEFYIYRNSSVVR